MLSFPGKSEDFPAPQGPNIRRRSPSRKGYGPAANGDGMAAITTILSVSCNTIKMITITINIFNYTLLSLLRL